jgi:aerobic C4-dicarboxylate transport protein
MFATVAEWLRYSERCPDTARADANLAEGNPLPEDMNDANPHPGSISIVRTG